MLFVKTNYNTLINISLCNLKYIEDDFSRIIIYWNEYEKVIKKSVNNTVIILKRLQEIEENYDIIEENELKEILEKKTKWFIVEMKFIN